MKLSLSDVNTNYLYLTEKISAGISSFLALLLIGTVMYQKFCSVLKSTYRRDICQGFQFPSISIGAKYRSSTASSDSTRERLTFSKFQILKNRGQNLNGNNLPKKTCSVSSLSSARACWILLTEA